MSRKGNGRATSGLDAAGQAGKTHQRLAEEAAGAAALEGAAATDGSGESAGLAVRPGPDREPPADGESAVAISGATAPIDLGLETVVLVEDDDGVEERAGDADADLAAPGQRDPDIEGAELARLADDGGPAGEAWPLDAPRLDAGADATGQAEAQGTVAAAEGDGVDPEGAAIEAALQFGEQGPISEDQQFDRYFPGWDGNVSRAFAAAAGATARIGFDRDAERAVHASAAAFIRANRDARAETIVIHLRRSGHADVPEATGRAAVAWRVFALALNELDALDLLEKAKAVGAEKLRQQAWPGEQALKPARAGGFAAQSDRL